jgi:hypothetical protein
MIKTDPNKLNVDEYVGLFHRMTSYGALLLDTLVEPHARKQVWLSLQNTGEASPTSMIPLLRRLFYTRVQPYQTQLYDGILQLTEQRLRDIYTNASFQHFKKTLGYLDRNDLSPCPYEDPDFVNMQVASTAGNFHNPDDIRVLRIELRERHNGMVEQREQARTQILSRFIGTTEYNRVRDWISVGQMSCDFNEINRKFRTSFFRLTEKWMRGQGLDPLHDPLPAECAQTPDSQVIESFFGRDCDKTLFPVPCSYTPAKHKQVMANQHDLIPDHVLRKIIFVDHEPLDSLLLAGSDAVVLLNDIGKRLKYASPSFSALYQEVFEKMSEMVGGQQKPTVLPKNWDMDMGERRYRIPYSFCPSVDNQNSQQNKLSLKASGSEHLYQLCHKLEDRRWAARLLEDSIPDMLLPCCGVINPGDDKELRELFEKYGTLVLKPLRSSGGYGAMVVNGYPHQLPQIRETYIVQPYVAWERSPSSVVFVTSDDVFPFYMIDQRIAGLSFRGSDFPSCSGRAKEIMSATIKVGVALQKQGYQGFLNLDFIEHSGAALCVEMNARVPYSLYPVLLATKHLKTSSFYTEQHEMPIGCGQAIIPELLRNGTPVYFLRELPDEMIRFRTIHC